MRDANACTSPRLAAAAASRRTEQQARYEKLLTVICRRRADGFKTARIKLCDLEALIRMAAVNDRALPSDAGALPVHP